MSERREKEDIVKEARMDNPTIPVSNIRGGGVKGCTKWDAAKKWWIMGRTAGSAKRRFYELLQKKYAFGDWHLDPVNFRPYAQEVVFTAEEYIERKRIKCIVEVGCGLGDIIGNIQVVPQKKYEKIGIDRNENVLGGAKFLHPSITFLKGSFEKCINRADVCLIMINFIHMIPEKELREEIQQLLLKNDVNLVIMDTFVRNTNTEYQFSHKGEYLFGEKYKCIRKSKGFSAAHGARRYIEYWEKIEI